MSDKKKKQGQLRENIGVMLRNGDRVSYKLKVALINTKHPDGTPRLVTILDDKEMIDLAGGEEFVTMYLPLEMTEPER